MCIRLGWTWDEVLDQIDHVRLEALRKSWEEYPPLCVTMALLAGIKPKEPATKNFHELLGMFPGGMIH